jgi:hypothetical protein
MAAYPGTYVHTADQAVPPLDDDLAGLLDDLYGFHPGLDQICDGIRHIALDRHTVSTTQSLVTMLAASTEPPGKQTDALALITGLVHRLLNADDNPCLRGLPADVQEQARKAAQHLTDHDAHNTPRNDLATAVYTLNPI